MPRRQIEKLIALDEDTRGTRASKEVVLIHIYLLRKCSIIGWLLDRYCKDNNLMMIDWTIVERSKYLYYLFICLFVYICVMRVLELYIDWK